MSPNNQNPYNQAPQQNGSGGYDVVPPLPGAPNSGHSGHNPYEFIVNPPKAPRPSPLSFGGSSAVKRLIAVVGLVVVIMVVLFVAVSLLAPKSPTAELISLAQREQEILRVAGTTDGNVTDQDTLNFTANVTAAIQTNQAAVLTYLTSHGAKLKTKQLALDQSIQTDQLLANAQTTDTYDTALVSNLISQLTTYQGLLKSAYNTTSSTKLKETLQAGFTADQLLLAQGKALSQ